MSSSRRSGRTTNLSVGLQEERLERQGTQNDERWNTRFEELLDYRSEHGDCNVPQRQGKLGTWVKRQRTLYLTGSLAQDRINRLDSIGFKWSTREEQWEARFKELLAYRSDHGDCDVPTSQGKHGHWVSKQRKTYLAGSLAQDRIDRLDSIGFKWTLKDPNVPWETRFKELVQYKANQGDCNIPQKQGQLGKWVDTQRTNYRKGKLSQDRINCLVGIGFDWAPPRGGSRKRKAPPSTRKMSLSRKERVSSPSTNVNSSSVGDGERGAEPNGFKGEGRSATSVLSLEVPPKRSDHNRATESGDEVDEIGALIYDQVIRRRQSSPFSSQKTNLSRRKK